MGNLLVPGGIRWSHASLFDLAHYMGISGSQDKSFTFFFFLRNNNNL